MTTLMGPEDALATKPLRAALFVDFDNIFIGLEKLDRNAAQTFATDPARWLSWLETGLPTMHDYGTEQLPSRAILVRRCYLNPVVMQACDSLLTST